MLQFTYKLKITERVKGKCNRHPRYNPEKDGRAGIRGGCSCCWSLYDLYQARMALLSENSSAGQRPGRAIAPAGIRQRSLLAPKTVRTLANDAEFSKRRPR
jgi:hypothetical protein